MPLYVFNITAAPVTLAVVTPSKVIPASATAGTRSSPVNVTTDLRGLTSANYVTLQAQVTAGALVYEWTNGYAEYATEALEVVRAPAGNLYLPADTVRSAVYIYARSTGSDTTGNGSLTTPYRTFQRAIRDVPIIVRGKNYIVDITGIGTETLPVGWQMPPFEGDSGSYLDLAPADQAFNSTSAVNIQAIPTVESTIPAANVMGQAANATTGLYTVTTNLALAPNALRGKWLKKPTAYYVIASNTATDIELSSTSSAAAGDIPICICSATLNQTDNTTVQPTVSINTRCSMRFRGISIQTAVASIYTPALVLQPTSAAKCPGVILNCCAIDGIYVPANSVTWIYDCWIERVQVLCGSVNAVMRSTLYSAASSTPLGPMETSHTNYAWSVIDTCTGIGTLIDASFGYSLSGYMAFEGCDIRNSPAEGIRLYSGVHTLNHCNIHNNAADGILLDGAKAVIHNCTGTTNVGYGLKMINAAYAKASNNTIAGTTNEIKVGAAAAETWANWAAAGGSDRNDLAEAKPQMCRLATT